MILDGQILAPGLRLRSADSTTLRDKTCKHSRDVKKENYRVRITCSIEHSD
jgi:hypothetical protein